MEAAFSWTPGRVDDLKRMIAAGESATQIAKHLGCPSRNAVLGKAYRLGLSTKAAPNWVREEGRAKARVKTPAPEPILKPRPNPVAPPAAPPPVLCDVEPLPPARTAPTRSVDLMKLQHGMCRFPFGEQTPFLFCAAPVSKEGASYCAEHTALCCTSPRARTAAEVAGDETRSAKMRAHALRRAARQNRGCHERA